MFFYICVIIIDMLVGFLYSKAIGIHIGTTTCRELGDDARTLHARDGLFAFFNAYSFR